MSAILVFTLVSFTYGSIVNNSTSSPTAEDSLSVVFYSLDSLGNPTTADSMYLLVCGPGGDGVCRDSMGITDGRIVSSTIASKQFYCFKEQVSNLDGAGSCGSYSLAILAKKNTGDLLTPNTFSFQIISNELSDQLALLGDSVYTKGGIIDTNLTEQNRADSTSIARWVWNTAQSGHTTAGSFGCYLDAEISGIGCGSGVYAYTVQAFDSTIDQTVPYVSLTVRNIDQSSLVAVGKTDSYGRAAFNLNTDSFVVTASAPGYIFEVFDTLVVSGAGVDTVFCDQFDPGAPVFPTQCRVYGYLFDVNAQPEIDVSVSAYLPLGIARFGLVTISPSPVTTATDSTGYFFLDLIPSDSLQPAGTEYEFTLSRRDGTILRQRLQVPDSTTWRLVW